MRGGARPVPRAWPLSVRWVLILALAEAAWLLIFVVPSTSFRLDFAGALLAGLAVMSFGYYVRDALRAHREPPTARTAEETAWHRRTVRRAVLLMSLMAAVRPPSQLCSAR